METLERFLIELGLDEHFSHEDMEFMIGCASNTYFRKNSYIFHYGDEANHFYIIREGKVAIKMPVPGHGEITIQTLGRGEIVGWCWIFPPYTRTFSAVAKEDTRAIAFDGECIRKKCDEHPRLGYDLMKYFSPILMQRLHNTRLQMLDIISQPETLELTI